MSISHPGWAEGAPINCIAIHLKTPPVGGLVKAWWAVDPAAANLSIEDKAVLSLHGTGLLALAQHQCSKRLLDNCKVVCVNEKHDQ